MNKMLNPETDEYISGWMLEDNPIDDLLVNKNIEGY